MLIEEHKIDERVRSSARWAAAIWLGVTQVLLAGAIFYRLYVLDQPDSELRDIQAVLAISIFGFIGMQLLLGGVFPTPTWKGALVAYLVQMGELTREQARTHPSGNILVRSVGSTDDVEIDVFHIPLQAGDALLLCTDGLWSELPDEDLQQVMVSTPDPQVICDAMVDLGNEAGGKDNITCLVVTM